MTLNPRITRDISLVLAPRAVLVTPLARDVRIVVFGDNDSRGVEYMTTRDRLEDEGERAVLLLQIREDLIARGFVVGAGAGQPVA